MIIKTKNKMIQAIGFHGTDKVFDSLSLNAEKRSNGTDGGLWFSSSPIVAQSYTAFGAYNMKHYIKALENGDINGDSIGHSSLIRCTLNFSNPYIFDAKGNDSGNLLNDWNNRTTIADLFNHAVANGHDGLIVHNVNDCGSYVPAKDAISTIYGIASENQIIY